MPLTTKHLMRTRRLEKLISIQDWTSLDKKKIMKCAMMTSECSKIYDIFMFCAFSWSSPNILRPGTLPSQHYINNFHNVCKQVCFSGFKYYHNPKHSGPYTAGQARGGGKATAPLEKTIFTIFRTSLLIILRIFRLVKKSCVRLSKHSRTRIP
jgi:hypothetical protein